MYAVRLLNAREARMGSHSFRYIITNPIHEALTPEEPIRVMDSVSGEVMLYAELLEKLPEDLRKRVLHS
jgi:hypothetical protein